MKWEFTYDKKKGVELTLVGDLGDRVGHQFNTDHTVFVALSPLCEQMLDETIRKEEKEVAVKQATAAAQAELDKITSERNTLQSQLDDLRRKHPNG